jgi:hypothetical protein
LFAACCIATGGVALLLQQLSLLLWAVAAAAPTFCFFCTRLFASTTSVLRDMAGRTAPALKQEVLFCTLTNIHSIAYVKNGCV